jgi:hypothetical protein
MMVLNLVLDKMNADDKTKKAVKTGIEDLMKAVKNNDIEAGVSCIDWKDGSESSIVITAAPQMMQILRLGKDNQLRGNIWVIREEDSRIMAAPINGSEDHSNYDLMKIHAEATAKQIKDVRSADEMAQSILGKKSNFQEPTVPDHMRLER